VSKLAAGMSLRKFEHSLFPKLLGRSDPLERAFTALELSAPHAFHASARSLVRWSESGRLPEMMRSLPCPACYVYGRRNHSKLSLDALDAVERQAIPDSGHFPMNENPSVFYAFLAAWLKKNDIV
jgi:pimeloyl-ACP methyl ester carboxylesterase